MPLCGEISIYIGHEYLTPAVRLPTMPNRSMHVSHTNRMSFSGPVVVAHSIGRWAPSDGLPQLNLNIQWIGLLSLDDWTNAPNIYYPISHASVSLCYKKIS